jgi:hypothetical protein
MLKGTLLNEVYIMRDLGLPVHIAYDDEKYTLTFTFSGVDYEFLLDQTRLNDELNDTEEAQLLWLFKRAVSQRGLDLDPMELACESVYESLYYDRRKTVPFLNDED